MSLFAVEKFVASTVSDILEWQNAEKLCLDAKKKISLQSLREFGFFVCNSVALIVKTTKDFHFRQTSVWPWIFSNFVVHR